MAKETRPLPGMPYAASSASGESALAMAVDHFNARRYAAAEEIALRLKQEDSKDGRVLNLLGGIALERSDFAGAVTHLTAASRVQGGNPYIWFNLGEAHRRGGAFAKSLPGYRKAVSIKSDFAEAYAMIGEAQRALNLPSEAEKAYRAALAINPHLTLALNGVGLAHLTAARFAEAARAFSEAIKASPRDPALHANLGQALYQSGDTPGALTAMLDAHALAPENEDFQRLLARSFLHVREAPIHTHVRSALMALFQSPSVNPRTLATAALSVLKREHDLDVFLQRIEANAVRADEIVADFEADLNDLRGDPLFIALLSSAPAPDIGFELALRAMRKHALLNGSRSLAFLCALARQCFLNEYIYYAGDDEKVALGALRATIAAEGGSWEEWALLSCYAPLYREAVKPRDGAPEAFAPLLREQIDEPLRELEIADRIRALKPLSDEVSLVVQAQYEESPYPRWTRFDLSTPRPFADVVKAALPPLPEKMIPNIAAPRILIGGCGTGLETMRILNSYQNASVLALDLSRTSIAYGMRKLNEYGFENVEHVHGDILD
ncbi:MAG: tetratricopeptide repeat protein, partial [Caulobacterales bacterium]